MGELSGNEGYTPAPTVHGDATSATWQRRHKILWILTSSYGLVPWCLFSGLLSNEGFDLRTRWVCSAKGRAEEGNGPQNSLRTSLGGAATSQWPATFLQLQSIKCLRNSGDQEPRALLSAQLKVGT